MSQHQDYEYLVAAHLLRSPDFAADYGPLFVRVEGRFFSNPYIRDVALYGIRYFQETGTLLPPAALKTDASLFQREGAHSTQYDRAIDMVWRVPSEELERSKKHVRKKVVEEVQSRVLLFEDLQGLCTPARLKELFALIDDVRTYGGEKRGGAVRLDDGLLGLLRDPPRGVPTGLPLDRVLDAGGLRPGEVAIFYGRWGIGKSMTLYHAARYAGEQHRPVLIWGFDSSLTNTRLRLLKSFLEKPEQWIRANPDLAYREYMERFGPLPIYVQHSPPGSTTKAEILVQADRIEQRLGHGLSVIAMDYSEKRAAGRDWQQVAAAYQELREICTERGYVGLDVAQENTTGTISYSNLLKDTDVGVQLTVMHPDEWRRAQRQPGRQENEGNHRIPTEGPVWGEVIKAKEGASGGIFEMWVDRSTGEMRERQLGGETGEHSEAKSTP